MNPQPLCSTLVSYTECTLPMFGLTAKPFNETIRLNGRSYQDCEEVYLSESTDDLLSLSCTASSKPSSRLLWMADPPTTALVVNQSTVAECNTAVNGIVTCESNATIVTKDLKDVVQVTCVTHFDDGQTVMTSKRACVVLVPHGTCWSITHVSFLDGSILNCMVHVIVWNILKLILFNAGDTY